MTSLLAMLFIVLFTMLAIGFAEATVLNAQIADNERTVQRTLTNADSGMAFIRYQLTNVNLPATTTSANLMSNLASELGSRLNGTANMAGARVVVNGNAIHIPSQTGWIRLDPGDNSRFRITITQSGHNLIVTSRGTSPDGSASRGVQMLFQGPPRHYALMGLSGVSMSSSAFSDSYDASKGKATLLGRYEAAKANSVGTVGSNGNITLSNTAKVNGDVMYGPAATATVAPTATVTGIVAPMLKTATFSSVTLPPAGSYTDLGDVTMSSGTVDVPGGTYVINKLTLSGTARINWTGPVKLYIKSGYSVTQNVVINTYDNLPVNRQLYFLPTCTTATWSGSNVCVGDLYAPDTNFTIGGSVQKMGRIIAKNITNSSTGGMHYDESLPVPNNGKFIFTPVPGSYLEVP